MEYKTAYLVLIYFIGYLMVVLYGIQQEVDKNDYTLGDVIKRSWPLLIAGALFCPVLVIAHEEIAMLNAYDKMLGNFLYIVFFMLGLGNQLLIRFLFWLIEAAIKQWKRLFNNY